MSDEHAEIIAFLDEFESAIIEDARYFSSYDHARKGRNGVRHVGMTGLSASIVACGSLTGIASVVLGVIEGGGDLRIAAAEAGISHHTLYRWRKWAASGREPYAEAFAGWSRAEDVGSRVRESRRTKVLRESPARDPDRRGVIYVLHDAVNDRIKIGFAVDFASRLSTYHTHAPHLVAIMTVAGTYRQERQTHKRFEGRAIFGREWYAASMLNDARTAIQIITGGAAAPAVVARPRRRCQRPQQCALFG